MADVLDRAKAVANDRRALRLIRNLEIEPASTDIWGQDLQPHAPALGSIQRHFLGNAHVNRKQGRHVLKRIICLQICGFHADHSVVGRMALRESISGERFPIVKNRIGRLARNIVGDRPLHKFLPLLPQHLGLLFCYRLAKDVGFGGREACQFHRRVHDLFLVDRDPVSFLENRFQGGMPISDVFQAVHASNVGRNKLHRSRTIERNHRRNMRQVGWFHLHQVAAHSGAFDLKHPQYVPASQQVVSLRVVQWDGLEVQLRTSPPLNEITGARHHGQGREAQIVDLKQTQRFQDSHIKLGNGTYGAVFLAALGRPVERNVFRDGFVGDDHACGVCACVSGDPFELGGRIDQLPDVFAALIGLLKVRNRFQRFRNRDRLSGNIRNGLGDPIYFRQRDIHHSSDIADGGSGAQRTEGDDLGHLVLAILLGRVFKKF